MKNSPHATDAFF